MALRVVSRMAEGPAGIHDAEVLGESEVAFLEDAPPRPRPRHTHTHTSVHPNKTKQCQDPRITRLSAPTRLSTVL